MDINEKIEQLVALCKQAEITNTPNVYNIVIVDERGAIITDYSGYVLLEKPDLYFSPKRFKSFDEARAVLNTLDGQFDTAKLQVKELVKEDYPNASFSYTPYEDQPQLINEITDLCNDLFITSSGQFHYGNARLLARFGYVVAVGERDSFGPLSSVLNLAHCTIVFG